MFLTVVFVWIGLSVFASLLALAAVVRGGQMEREARDRVHAEEHARPKSSSFPPNSGISARAGHSPAPEQG